MGFFWEGVPPYLLPWCSSVLNEPRIAIETGTFRGDTALLLAEALGICISIERSPHFAEIARARFKTDSRVTILEGGSREKLLESVPSREISAFFWLDAHGVYDFAGVDPEENPLLFEIETILANRDSDNTIIAIDDARGMGTKPDWPAISDISIPLGNAGYKTVYLDDIFLAVPERLQADLWKLYDQSRMVEASFLFHVWPRVLRSLKIQAGINAIYQRLSRSK